jgi:hypothetical protein
VVVNLKQRKFTCIYSDRDPDSPSDAGKPTKRRALDGDHASPSLHDNSVSGTPTNGHQIHSPLARPTHASPVLQRPRHTGHDSTSNPMNIKPEGTPFQDLDERPTIEAASSLQQLATGQPVDGPLSRVSRGSTVLSGPDEEAVVYTQSRMLQDPTGRLR